METTLVGVECTTDDDLKTKTKLIFMLHRDFTFFWVHVFTNLCVFGVALPTKMCLMGVGTTVGHHATWPIAVSVTVFSCLPNFYQKCLLNFFLVYENISCYTNSYYQPTASEAQLPFTRPEIREPYTHCFFRYKGAPLHLARQCVHIAFTLGLWSVRLTQNLPILLCLVLLILNFGFHLILVMSSIINYFESLSQDQSFQYYSFHNKKRKTITIRMIFQLNKLNNQFVETVKCDPLGPIRSRNNLVPIPAGSSNYDSRYPNKRNVDHIYKLLQLKKIKKIKLENKKIKNMLSNRLGIGKTTLRNWLNNSHEVSDVKHGSCLTNSRAEMGVGSLIHKKKKN
ncbi:hypothetical protein VP01_333g5 [Puccinia sorghi]|uniref:Uncharacterized protein n=1 Tax=Puccinia sorghi TaxID=27349 RepID=A0A0L6UX74_9BASI|nr:hypothetical protein VP01_333g5 [Puccinia sorghi]